MAYEKILYTVEKGVATITMNIPEKLNAHEERLIHEIQDVTDVVADDKEIGAVIITGSGRAFSAGGDLEYIKEGFTAVEGREYISRSIPWMMKFVQMEKPVIAAVNGLAVGSGFSMVLLCDFIFMAENAKIGMPFVQVGLVPDIGSMYFLPRLIGLPRAKELYVTGRMVKAEEALQMGIANRVFPDDKLMEKSTKFAAKLASGPRVAIKLAKRIMNSSSNLTLEELMEYEAYAQSICFQTEDHREAVQAFFEKRVPKFKGK